LTHDKVTVEEPLISTDVDSLIRTLAERKKVALNELRQLVKIDKKTLDKWIAVLEDEGYIVVEYGLRGTNILWKDTDEAPAPTPYVPEAPKTVVRTNEQAEEEPREAVFSEAAQSDSGEPETGEEINEEFTTEVPLEEEPEPEDLLNAYVAKKKGGSGDIDSIKSNILTNLEEQKSERRRHPAGSPDDKPEPAEPEDEPEEPVAAEEETIPEEAPEKSVFPPRTAQTIRPTDKERPMAADVRELMNSYLAEINKEKARVEALKKEREALYREKFVTMEGKLQADIVVLTEKVIEKESKIAELKERVLELPDKVDQLSKLQSQMENLKKEGREALSRTRAKADEFLVGLNESKEEVEEKISEVENVIGSQEVKLKELEKLGESLDTRSAKLKSSLENAKSQLEEIQSAMGALDDDLQKAGQLKVDIDSMTDSIKQTVAAHGEELMSLEEELEGIARVEKWVQEYIRDYESKIDGIEQYVEKSEDELADLKEAAESLYLKKYLGELENMTDAYESELHDAVARERDIENKLSESRSRITELVKESQEMIKKLRSEAPEEPEKDFGVMVAKVKARTTRTKNLVEEKQQERAKLADDSRKTRKTVKPAPSKGKVVLKKVASAKAPAKGTDSKKKRK
jgi:chromosome segregation ATPase